MQVTYLCHSHFGAFWQSSCIARESRLNGLQRKALYLDQIHENMKEEKAMEILDQPLDEDKAGQGQNYCIHCE